MFDVAIAEFTYVNLNITRSLQFVVVQVGSSKFVNVFVAAVVTAAAAVPDASIVPVELTLCF